MDSASFSKQVVEWHGLLVEFEFACCESNFGQSVPQDYYIEVQLGRVGLHDVQEFMHYHPRLGIDMRTLEALVESNEPEVIALATEEAQRIIDAHRADYGCDGSASW